MSIDPFSDAKIVDSWRKNASPWIEAVREGQIKSRKLSTDDAVVNAILSRSPASVIDLGCGEGWLARTLAAKGIQVLGTDVVPDLTEQARLAGGDFRLMSYEDVALGKLKATADVTVCNFSLFGKESVEGMFGAVPALLNARGSFIVQTLHPITACGDSPYRDGWRKGSWAGFNAGFTDPAPWFFRTLENWVRLFLDNGFRLHELREPIDPESGKPVSVIFIAEAAAY